MLNISPNSITHRIPTKGFSSFSKVELSKANSMFTRWVVGGLFIAIVFLFLPWTQNIQSKGTVTTLQPNQRPQTIHSTIAGRIEKWYVQEGQLVRKGDTIVHLSEIKADYFDPQLVERTNRQVDSKSGSISAYSGKVTALDQQIQAMRQELVNKSSQLSNKIQQMRFKIAADSIDLVRAKNDLTIAQRQLDRTQSLYEQGIKSLADVEDKRVKMQETLAKKIGAENKLESSRNELENSRLALDQIQFTYNQKIAKASSDKFSTLSARYEAEADLDKLRIQATNYSERSQFYFIVAPQDCYITKALKSGVGETVKEGTAIVSIMPSDYELAVELYVKPMDLPLVEQGQEVRFIFDGWPAFVFSGWPDQSFGTYRGTVMAIDNYISPKGEYRILVAADEHEKAWPQALRPGSGAQGIALLKRVPLWYEIWRKLNGFPPDYYDKEDDTELPKMKAPVKSIK